MHGLAGVTAIEVNAAAVTVSAVAPLTVPSVAVIVEVPDRPARGQPGRVIVATVRLADAQVTDWSGPPSSHR